MISIFKNEFADNTILSYGMPMSNSLLTTEIGSLNKSCWHTIYHTNFKKSEEDSRLIFDNKPWDKINEQNSSELSVTENGFQIQINEKPSEWFDCNRTSPGIILNLNDLFDETNYFLNNLRVVDFRILIELSGTKFSHSYEDVSVGLEIRNKQNNFVSVSRYYDSEQQNKLRTSFVKTDNGISTEFTFDFAQESIAGFCIKDINSIDLFTLKEDDFYQILSKDNLNSVRKKQVFWKKDLSNRLPIFTKPSELNFVFCVGTTYDYRDVVGIIKNIAIQIKPK